MARWFRSHASKLDNPKVQRLSDAHYRAWDSLLCIACRYDGVLPCRADMAFLMRKSEDATTKLVETLTAAGLFVKTERGVEPHEWNEWQYKSDVSTPRVKRFREQQRNVSETPSESEDREQIPETEREEGAPARETQNGTTENEGLQLETVRGGRLDASGNGKHRRSSDRGSRLPADWKPTPEELTYAADQGCADPSDTAERFRLHHLSKGTLGKDWHSGFQFWCRNEKNFQRSGGSDETHNQRRIRLGREALRDAP